MTSLNRSLSVVGMLGFVSFGHFVPPSPFLVIKVRQTQSSQILVEPHLINAEIRKAWMLFFCRYGHPVVTVDQFWRIVGLCLRSLSLIFLGLRGAICRRLLGRKSLPLGD